MALAKERIGQGCSFYGVGQEAANASFVGLLGFESYQRMVVDDRNDEENEDTGMNTDANFNRLPPLSDPNYETGIMFGDLINSHPEQTDHQVVINFKAAGAGSGGLVQSYGPLLNFQQGEDIMMNERGVKARNAMDHSYWWHNENRASEVVNCFETSSSSVVYHTGKDKQVVDEEIGWLYADGGATEGREESASPERNLHNKRPHVGSETDSRKKQQPVAGSRKPKAVSVSSKDPQSIAAKNRRERISERLKILQDLVPNGSKVDLVTMLEKAISYVKFLQLQVKVLATDEFWPAQGGKAPEISQVKEAIDAILSSQRDGTSSSN